MKKTKSLAGGLLVLLLLGSCEKLDEYFNDDNLVVTGCELAAIYAPWNAAENGMRATTGVCTYNSDGQPVSIVFDRTCLIGAPAASYLFRYDAQHRLTDYIEACDNTFDKWHVYKYNNDGLIVQDSTYVRGVMKANSHPSESAQSRRSTIFTYDAKDRITRAIEYLEAPNEGGTTTIYTDTLNYNYNSDGNLIRPGANYDAKINICRTNKIWMFINRDYSRNNYMPALSYNEKGLPLAFPVSYANFPFSYADTGSIKFEYNCNGK